MGRYYCMVAIVILWAAMFVELTQQTDTELNITNLEQNTSFAYLQAEVSSDYTLNNQQVACQITSSGSDCSAKITGYAVSADGTSANITLEDLANDGTLYSVTVTADNVNSSLGSVEQNIFLCMDPVPDAVDWYRESTFDQTNMELPDYADNYDVTVISDIDSCNITRTFVPYPNFPHIIYQVSRGCEFRVLYARICPSGIQVVPDFSSNFVQFPETFCTDKTDEEEEGDGGGGNTAVTVVIIILSVVTLLLISVIVVIVLKKKFKLNQCSSLSSSPDVTVSYSKHNNSGDGQAALYFSNPTNATRAAYTKQNNYVNFEGINNSGYVPSERRDSGVGGSVGFNPDDPISQPSAPPPYTSGSPNAVYGWTDPSNGGWGRGSPGPSWLNAEQR
ncbi:uncharacterized protein LOC142340471 [Convolutriloba macropyga]|uniref:uncharacterized protein LOC142340471 n=1 Tax=Convolutriloba macropyga TaxID=536237 RepID=UPI003F521311